MQFGEGPQRKPSSATVVTCVREIFKGDVSRMKKEELRSLIEKHLVLRKRLEDLQRTRDKLEDRYEEVGQLLYGFRSKKFLRSVLLYLKDLRREYGKDPHFDDLVDSVIHSLRDHENMEQRKVYTPKHLWHLYEEELQ